MQIHDVPTPALTIDADVFDRNLATMATEHPGRALRPHVKAHKCSAIAAVQQAIGHDTFTCATPREIVGMAAAGVGVELLLANETVDDARLAAMAELDVPVIVAVDSDATVEAAARNGITACLIDVNVGLPRCGVAPEHAGRLAETARRAGLEVTRCDGVRGPSDDGPRPGRTTLRRRAVDGVARARRIATWAGPIISAGGTGTFDLHGATGVTEVQAGSYALMDTHYGRQGLPFEQALFVVGTVISVSDGWSVADVGLKALGMDHGNPSVVGGSVWFCSDEHLTYAARPIGPRSATGSGSCPPTSTRRWRCTTPPGSFVARRSSTGGRSTSEAGDAPLVGRFSPTARRAGS